MLLPRQSNQAGIKEVYNDVGEGFDFGQKHSASEVTGFLGLFYVEAGEKYPDRSWLPGWLVFCGHSSTLYE